jgi:hypothetical protein
MILFAGSTTKLLVADLKTITLLSVAVAKLRSDALFRVLEPYCSVVTVGLFEPIDTLTVEGDVAIRTSLH